MTLFAATLPSEFVFILMFISLAYCIHKAKKWAKENPEVTGPIKGQVKSVILNQIKKKLGG